MGVVPLLVRFYEKVAPEEALNKLICSPNILSLSLNARIKPRYWYAPFRFQSKCVWYEARCAIHDRVIRANYMLMQ